MAIYHCSVQVIGRNDGRSSVAAAAYRAGEDLVNEYDGIEHDFTKKNWVEYTEIILPDNAPTEYSDRSTLWNAVEMLEKSKDAQLCREFELALPIELTRKQQIEVAEQFAREKLVSQGMIVDIAIHNPPVVNDRHQPIDKDGNPTKDVSKMQFINPHAHIMVTMRPMDEKGKWLTKSKTEYLCIRDGEEKGFTAQEFKEAKEDGWKKQYKYTEGKKKVWLTAEEGQERGLERVNRSPKTTPYGRKNEIIEYWDSKDRIFEWRQHWEKVVNDKFASLNSETRIDCRSFKDQGCEDELPTLHMGTAATNMERRAEREIHEGKPEAYVVHSDIGNINKQIKEHNRFVRELKAKIDAMVEAVKDFVGELARKLEGIRAKIIGNKYEESILSHDMRFMASKMNPIGARLEKYRVEIFKAEKANEKAAKEIKKLKKELVACTPIQFLKKKQLQEQIQELQEQIETRKDYMQSIRRMCGYASDPEYQEAAADYSAKYKDYEKMETTVNRLQQDNKQLLADYQSEIRKEDHSITEELRERREVARSEMETATKSKLKEKYGYGFEEGKFADARRDTDENLGIKAKKVNIKQLIRDNKVSAKQKEEQTPELSKKKSNHHHR
ncbi:MAG: MobA/MobL family protein [Oribacterium sp.]|nr:MobA/MobL family protein [Oribacterium sp.]